MREVIARVEQVAPTDLCVLITGESGTGKEVFARTLHSLSKRRKERMVSLNCGAIPETLLESELFGSEKGAYTGATEQRKGFFEAADKGTIFLDELGEMPLGTQVKLLRVLETGEFSRLGSPDVIRTDVRVLAATNRRLEDEVAEGRFRQDLFYRLNTVQIEIPPLREHPEDIPELVQYFAERTARKIGADYEGISHEALRLLMNLPWAGNIRELRNLIETVTTLSKGHQITLESLRPYLPRALKQPDAVPIPLPYPALPPANVVADTVKSDPVGIMAFLPDAQRQHLLPASSALMRVSGKMPEQIERELMYKALVDLVREVALLRGEVADLKDAVFSHHHDTKDSAQNSPNGATMQRVEQDSPNAFTRDTADDDNHSDAHAPLTMHEVEKRLISAALNRFDGNRRQVADALGISERTLYRKLREYGFSEASPEHND